MLSGHITALRPFDQSADATPDTAMLVQHDMPTTGGTSGSPVVNALGEVVAVNNSGFGGGGQSNFAVRADALSQLLGWVRSGSVAPLDLTQLSPFVGDGSWTIAWNDPAWQNWCIWVDSGVITDQSIGCIEWVDVVDMEISYNYCFAESSGENTSGGTTSLLLWPAGDEQFYAEIYVDGELAGTGLMTR